MVATTGGKPPRINRQWFRTRYGQSFPDLLSEEMNDVLDTSIEDVYTLFHGVQDIWSHLERGVYERKTQLCYGLLVAWYITDLYPTMSLGVIGTGGIPLVSKSIGGVKLQFSDATDKAGSFNNADLLKFLKSNTYGSKAYMMIKTSGKINLFFSHGGC